MWSRWKRVWLHRAVINMLLAIHPVHLKINKTTVTLSPALNLNHTQYPTIRNDDVSLSGHRTELGLKILSVNSSLIWYTVMLKLWVSAVKT